MNAFLLESSSHTASHPYEHHAMTTTFTPAHTLIVGPNKEDTCGADGRCQFWRRGQYTFTAYQIPALVPSHHFLDPLPFVGFDVFFGCRRALGRLLSLSPGSGDASGSDGITGGARVPSALPRHLCCERERPLPPRLDRGACSAAGVCMRVRRASMQLCT
jgi:hypothetical protein